MRGVIDALLALPHLLLLILICFTWAAENPA